jgi:DNA-directed RNA polymerase II subunit RPB1
MSVLDPDTPGLTVPDLYDNTEPKKGGLIDQRMGVTSNELECLTCGLSTNYCVGHFGHMNLAEPVFHMGFYEYVISILRCVCIKCSKLLVYKNEEEIIEILKSKSGKSRNRLNEIKNLVKNVTYCQKQHYGCGAPVPKIKAEKKKTTVEINIIAEYTVANASEENPDKKPIREVLTPNLVYNILKNISDTDCLIMGIDPKKNRPEDLIHTIFPIPPVQVRPSVRGDLMASTTREDHLTVKLSDILKANIRISKHKENLNENTLKYFPDHVAYLQYHVATYYDNESLKLPESQQKGIVTKSLASRLKGKEGRIRNNLMGKRTDFSGRTVITPDPNLSINELGMPIQIAKNITFPEIVTPYNIDYLGKLVRNGREKYPGANFVIPISAGDSDSKLPIDLRFRKEKIELRYGDVVERHIQNGDIVLLNRQPTLHKQSMMGHRVKVINNPNYCTFRINPNVTTP